MTTSKVSSQRCPPRMSDPIDVAKQCFLAYANSDRAAIERIIADDFCFTSPLDNQIDRQTYFERCWPNHERITAFDFIALSCCGDRVFVTYEADSKAGKRFRNTEVLTVRAGQVVAAEVYFGWNLPHKAEPGGYVASE